MDGFGLGVVVPVAFDADEVARLVAARPDAAEVAKNARTLAARDKAASAAAQQPPDIAKVGVDSDKMGGKLDAGKAIKLSQEQFAKLDDETLARLRGDELV